MKRQGTPAILPGLPLIAVAFYAVPMFRPFSARSRARPAAFAAVLLGPALLGSCASPNQFPSLIKRPNELAAEGRISACGIPVAPPLVPPPSPAATPPQLPLPADLAGRIAALESQARAAHADFAEKHGRAASLVSAAAGADRASDAWSVASVALAELSTARSQTATALADLDQLYAAARVNGQSVDGGDGQAIAAVRDQVTAWVADEDAVLAGLVGRLGG